MCRRPPGRRPKEHAARAARRSRHLLRYTGWEHVFALRGTGPDPRPVVRGDRPAILFSSSSTTLPRDSKPPSPRLVLRHECDEGSARRRGRAAASFCPAGASGDRTPRSRVRPAPHVRGEEPEETHGASAHWRGDGSKRQRSPASQGPWIVERVCERPRSRRHVANMPGFYRTVRTAPPISRCTRNPPLGGQDETRADCRAREAALLVAGRVRVLRPLSSASPSSRMSA
jgi:hypothetical protein